jgi:fibrillarin-like pre-rRNA processing protein
MVEILPGVYLLQLDGRERLATKSESAKSVYGERFVGNYRFWDPYRSKFAAFLLKARKWNKLGKEKILNEKSKVLYLGAASGTTVSHVSDIVRDGVVYAVEFSSRSMQDLVNLCESRKNIAPILADASKPVSYCHLVEKVDLIYQDVAQKNQSEIASLNCDQYLKPLGTLIMMIKARSIDAVASPRDVYDRELNRLKDLEIVMSIDLLPYHHDHLALLALKT